LQNGNVVHFDDYLSDVLQESGISREEFSEQVNRLKQQHLGLHLADLRKTAGFTQKQLASKLQVTPIRISQIENGNLAKQNISTLTNYLSAVGADLKLSVSFAGTDFELKDLN